MQRVESITIVASNEAKVVFTGVGTDFMEALRSYMLARVPTFRIHSGTVEKEDVEADGPRVVRPTLDREFVRVCGFVPISVCNPDVPEDAPRERFLGPVQSFEFTVSIDNRFGDHPVYISAADIKPGEHLPFARPLSWRAPEHEAAAMELYEQLKHEVCFPHPPSAQLGLVGVGTKFSAVMSAGLGIPAEDARWEPGFVTLLPPIRLELNRKVCNALSPSQKLELTSALGPKVLQYDHETGAMFIPEGSEWEVHDPHVIQERWGSALKFVQDADRLQMGISTNGCMTPLAQLLCALRVMLGELQALQIKLQEKPKRRL